VIGYIIRRLITAVFLLVVVRLTTFAIFFLIPRLAGQRSGISCRCGRPCSAA
jgi:peptide/nickel transport system permease protein